jgi:hypothetical protein
MCQLVDLAISNSTFMVERAFHQPKPPGSQL